MMAKAHTEDGMIHTGVSDTPVMRSLFDKIIA